MCFWNIAGIKNMEEDEKKEMDKMEVIGLIETWETGKKFWERRFKERAWRSKEAIKEKKRGRASGGLVLAIKERKGMSVKWLEGDNEETIGALVEKKDKNKVIVIIVYMNKKKEENLEVIKRWIEEEPGTQIIIGRDFNAKTGGEGGVFNEYGESHERKREDKVVNREGKVLINWMNELGIGILNEVGNEGKGDYTYVGARGSTIIDYVLKKEYKENLEKRIEVRESTKSDHMKIIYSWVEKNVETEEKRKEYEVICWEKEHVEKYKEMLIGIGVENRWDKIKARIQNAMQKKKKSYKGNYKKRERWWDDECVRKRKEMLKITKETKKMAEKMKM